MRIVRTTVPTRRGLITAPVRLATAWEMMVSHVTMQLDIQVSKLSCGETVLAVG